MNKEGEIKGLRHDATMEYRLRNFTVLLPKVILNQMRAATITIIAGFKCMRFETFFLLRLQTYEGPPDMIEFAGFMEAECEEPR